MKKTKEERIKDMNNRMSSEVVNLTTKKTNLLELFENNQISGIIRCFNLVEWNPDKVKQNVTNPRTTKKFFDYGIRLSTGETIRHIDSVIFSFIKKQSGFKPTDIRERIPTNKIKSQATLF